MKNSLFLVFLFYLIAISLVAMVVTIVDKIRAARNERRIPESTLLLLSALGGSAAMFFTMLLIRHETKRAKFMVGIPLMLVGQLIVLRWALRTFGPFERESILPPSLLIARIYGIAVSLVSVVVTAADKIRAKRNEWRVPESTLLLLSALGGSAAMYITMLLIRHKTKHRQFMVGIPLMFVCQLIVVLWAARHFGLF